MSWCAGAEVQEVEDLEKWMESKIQQNKALAEKRNGGVKAFVERNSPSIPRVDHASKKDVCLWFAHCYGQNKVH